MTIKAVIFDMGGVLIPAPMTEWQHLEQEKGLQPGSIVKTLLETEMKDHFKRLERGETTCEDFEPLFTHVYNQTNNRKGDIIPIFSAFVHHVKNIPIVPEMVDLLVTLRAGGIKTILVTNNFYADRARRVATIPDVIPGYFDQIIESCRVGLRKPDNAIYHLACEKAGAKPEECVFMDDLGVNLKPARELGIVTIKVNSPTQGAADVKKAVSLDHDYPPETRDCIQRELLDERKLIEFLGTKLGLNGNSITIRKFRHGQSNPTYYIKFGGKELVLRKKPSGQLLPKAHQIDREFQILKALDEHVPVPKVLIYDES